MTYLKDRKKEWNCLENHEQSRF